MCKLNDAAQPSRFSVNNGDIAFCSKQIHASFRCSNGTDSINYDAAGRIAKTNYHLTNTFIGKHVGDWPGYFNGDIRGLHFSAKYLPDRIVQGIATEMFDRKARNKILDAMGHVCDDDHDFIDVKAFDCLGWAGFNCFELWEGYTSADLVQVQSACRMTCGLCPCEDDLSFSDHKGYDCVGWAGYPCYRGQDAADSYIDYTNEQLANLRRSCPASCGLCPQELDVLADLSDTVTRDTCGNLARSCTARQMRASPSGCARGYSLAPGGLRSPSGAVPALKDLEDLSHCGEVAEMCTHLGDACESYDCSPSGRDGKVYGRRADGNVSEGQIDVIFSSHDQEDFLGYKDYVYCEKDTEEEGLLRSGDDWFCSNMVREGLACTGIYDEYVKL